MSAYRPFVYRVSQSYWRPSWQDDSSGSYTNTDGTTYKSYASQKEIEPVLYETGSNDLTIAYEYLKDYYDSNILSCFLAPLFPKYSRNVLWEVRLCGNQI